MGPTLQSVTSNDASKSLAPTRREQARRRPAAGRVRRRQGHAHHRRVQLRHAAHRRAEGGHRRGRGLAHERRRARSTAPACSSRRTARAPWSSPAWTATRARSRSATRCSHPRPLRRHRERACRCASPGPAASSPTSTRSSSTPTSSCSIGTVILVLVLLLLIYRSPVLPFVPLITVGFGYFVAGGLLAIGANAFGDTLSGQATSLMVILLFGAGTDYGLLLISRYREELRHEPDARTALATALAETWEAIAASGLTVTLAVLTLSFAEYGDYTSFAPVLGGGVFITLIAALTLMPAHPRPARAPRLLAARAQAGRPGARGPLAAHRRARGRGPAALRRRRRGASSSCSPWAASSTARASASPTTSSRACRPRRASRCSRSTSPRGRWRRPRCSSRPRRRRPSSSPA